MLALDEWLEDIVEKIVFDPAAGVANVDAQVLLIDAATHLDPAAISEFGGIGEKIEQNLFEFVTVDGDYCVRAANEGVGKVL